jgi:hypothetical protein
MPYVRVIVACCQNNDRTARPLEDLNKTTVTVFLEVLQTRNHSANTLQTQEAHADNCIHAESVHR